MPEVKDKRAALRETVHLVAEIEVEGREVGCGVSRDASEAGLLLLTHLDLRPGSELVLKLFAPGEAEPRRLEATVVRSERVAPSEGIVWDYRFAVALRNPPRDLAQLVENLSKR